MPADQTSIVLAFCDTDSVKLLLACRLTEKLTDPAAVAGAGVWLVTAAPTRLRSVPSTGTDHEETYNTDATFRTARFIKVEPILHPKACAGYAHPLPAQSLDLQYRSTFNFLWQLQWYKIPVDLQLHCRAYVYLIPIPERRLPTYSVGFSISTIDSVVI